ncbi:MAG: hypothetical protein LBO20_10940, partial [Bifidobacteriaceae bacterium]|nr:hypothetical protein [Bifidobacteriaceae bacterium]
LVDKDAVLPSVYTSGEVARLAAVAGRSGRCPRRDRAVVLLAAQLGMRVETAPALDPGGRGPSPVWAVRVPRDLDSGMRDEARRQGRPLAALARETASGYLSERRAA